MTTKPTIRKILIDEPTSQDFFHGKGHERTANALANAIRNFKTNDRAIGLDGPWGSGKSSVVYIAHSILNAEKASNNFHFFTFDIWSSQGASFRRSFLEHFIRWSKQTFPKKFTKLDEIEKEVRGKTKVINSKNKSILDWYGVVILLFLPMLPIYYIWSRGYFGDSMPLGDFLVSTPLCLFYVFLLLTALRALCRFADYLKYPNKSGDKMGVIALFQMAVSQTLLISTKSYEDQTVTEHIREVDPNDFEFQATFRRILGEVQTGKNKIVVVLDNIDRLPKDEIDEYWALVRSVFSRGGADAKPSPEEAITAIVPYDRHLIGASDLASNDDVGKNGLRSIKSREIFSKTFDEILVVAPPVMSNSKEFFYEKMRSALPNYGDENELFKVYLIFNQIIMGENGKTTPRQILSFINELTGIYILHEARIGLPTIAVFIAYQDDLELNPTKLTEPKYIADRLKNIAADEELERNLAALIFNVEPNLAFQILLDDQIRSASVAQTSDGLTRLASAPGFELRVGDVISSNSREWKEAGDFGTVIGNYAMLVGNDDLASKEQYFDVLVDTFLGMDVISVRAPAYAPFIKIFDMARSTRATEIAEHFVSCAFQFLERNSATEFKDGDDLAKLILAVKQAESKFRDLPSGQTLKIAFPVQLQVPALLFGVAASTYESEIAFKSLGVKDLGVEESTYLEDIAVESPTDALRAFSEFQAAGLMKAAQWGKIGNASLERIVEESGEEFDEISALMLVVEKAWLHAGDERSTINVKPLLEMGNLYANLYDAYSGDTTADGFEAALLLFCFDLLSHETEVADEDGETHQYNWLLHICTGQEIVPDSVYSKVGELIIRAGVTGTWTNKAKQNPENQFLSNVVRKIYTGTNVPSVQFNIFVGVYQYLKSVLSDSVQLTFNLLADRASKESFAFVTFDNIPLDMISDSFKYGNEKWSTLHLKIDQLLGGVVDTTWREELNTPGKISAVLEAKLLSSGYLINSSTFRMALSKYIGDVLNNEANPGNYNYDRYFEAVDRGFHPDMFRKIREALTSVSTDSLAQGQARFPNTLSAVISGGDRITKSEKDSIVRNILSSALESENRRVLDYFVEMGSSRVRDFIKGSTESSQKRVEAAERSFQKNHKDVEYARRMADLLHGKKKARNMFEAFWGMGERGD